MKVAQKNDTERYLVVVYRSREEKNQVLHELGLPADERYLVGDHIILSLKQGVYPHDLNLPRSAPIHKAGATG